MKTVTVLAFAALLSTMTVMSCKDSNRDNNKLSDAPPDSTAAENNTPDNAQSRGTADSVSQNSVNSQPLDKKSGNFATEAGSGGLLEVNLGQLAQQNAQNPRVKAFGEMMVKDHSDANAKLKSITDAKSFALPASPMEKHQHHIDMLSKKQGAEFDKAYMKMMTEDHKKDIKEFEEAAASSTDPELKTFAGNTLPVLRKHLDSAQAILKDLK